MRRMLVLNVVGLSKNLLGKETPFINSILEKGSLNTIDHVVPAVTCSVQTTYLTGEYPSEHGIVGNGWYFKDLSEIMFWKQSNHLVKGEMIWEAGKKRNSNFTCAQLFWWYNMYNTADWSVTPRPLYPIDGRKVPDIYCSDEGLRKSLNKKLGQFPLFNFWGPTASIKSTQWITQCALEIEKSYNPTLNLVYLPHLDYCLQKYGVDSKQTKKELKKIDDEIKKLVKKINQPEMDIIILSEYGISNVSEVIYPNRVLREMELLGLKQEFEYEMLDPGASKAFGVCDHQICHIYVNDKAHLGPIIDKFKNIDFIEDVIFGDRIKNMNLAHSRSGDIILIAKNNSWFSYYFWNDDEKAPDYARTVDIHRKPGYDPVELFFNPKIKFVKFKILMKVVLKKLGFNISMKFIPLNSKLVKGSHGGKPETGFEPVFITNYSDEFSMETNLSPVSIKDRILRRIFTSL